MEHLNIILTGFMGTGKSTLGKILARRLDREFVDTDTLIESRTGLTIPQIFAEQGEQAFRQLESSVARELAQREKLVISTGGGFMLNPENHKALNSNSEIFCLTASPGEIIKRLSASHSKTTRPLLASDNPEKKILQLLKEREPCYRQFHQIDTNSNDQEQIITEIIGLLKKD